MKVLVLGSGGQLGRTLLETVPEGVECLARDRQGLDVTDGDAVQSFVRTLRPAVVINAAAYTAVDRAESESALARRVNVDGARNAARAAAAAGARIVHVSTDFVFDGDKRAPYRPDDATAPLGVYGRTKRDGELAVFDAAGDAALVLRTAWLYSRHGRNFVTTMLRLMAERDELRVVDDQVGAPTWCGTLASAIWTAAARPVPGGTYHWTDDGTASWYEFAVEIRSQARGLGIVTKDVAIVPVPAVEYPTAARRPRYSVLDCRTTRAALGLEGRHWKTCLKRMLEGMND